MRLPSRDFLRDRVPAFGLAALLQLAAVWLIIHALVTPTPPPQKTERETQIVFLPTLPTLPLPAKAKRLRRPTSGANALTTYVNPYTFNAQPFAAPRSQGLASALSACDVDKYDMASDEIRAACARIGALIKHDPGRFGFTTHVADAPHWQRELARREAPLLAPCMSASGVDVLYTLTCIYEEIFTGHREDKRQRYSE
jgi:hypothetical protein